MQWFRDQIQRDIAFFESRKADYLSLEAQEIWRDTRFPEATKAKIQTGQKVLNEILFRLNRLLSKKQPWNKGELKPPTEGKLAILENPPLPLDPLDEGNFL